MFEPYDDSALTHLSSPAPTATLPEQTAPDARTGLVLEGLRHAASISHPIARARHRFAWALRLAAASPELAAELAFEFPEDSFRLLEQVVQDRLRRGDMELEPHFTRALDASRAAPPDIRLRVLNTLSEAAVDLAARSPERARELLLRLADEAGGLPAEADGGDQTRVLAAALVGEALLAAGDTQAGLPLLEGVEATVMELPGREPILQFLASTLSGTDPARAAVLAAALEDPGTRLETRLQVARKAEGGPLREELLDGVETDARYLEHYRGAEVLAQVGEALIPLATGRARTLLQEALESADRSGSQFRSLQWTGVASAATGLDREWAESLFREAVAAADGEPEAIRRITTWVLIANEMAEGFPRAAADLFQRAMSEAAVLDSNWELGHVADIVFRPDRSPYLDVCCTRPVLDRLLDRLQDEDPRIPGVIGLAEVAQWMAQVDPAAALPIYRRWFRAAEAASDSDGMTAAAVLLHAIDPDAGAECLRAAAEYLLRRIDCPAMGEFARQAAAIDPERVLLLAERIPDRREREEARANAAVELYDRDPERALALLRGLERPLERSAALLRLADRLLETADRARPQPLLEDLP